METGRLERGQIRLVVGGETFLTSFTTLANAPMDSILHGIQSCLKVKGYTSGTEHIDRSADGFHHILDFLRYETVPEQELRDDIEFGKRLKQQANYYGIAEMVNRIDEICGFPKRKLESEEPSRGKVLLEFKNGEIIKTSLTTLEKAPETSRLNVIYHHHVSQGGLYFIKPQSCVPYFIDWDPKYFHHVVAFLQTDSLPEFDKEVSGLQDAIIDEAKFYGLPEMLEAVKPINK